MENPSPNPNSQGVSSALVATWLSRCADSQVRMPHGNGGFLRPALFRDWRKVERVDLTGADASAFEVRCSDGSVFTVQVSRKES